MLTLGIVFLVSFIIVFLVICYILIYKATYKIQKHPQPEIPESILPGFNMIENINDTLAKIERYR